MINLEELKIGDKLLTKIPIYVSSKIGEKGIPALPGDEFLVMYIGPKYSDTSTSPPNERAVVIELVHVLTRHIVTFSQFSINDVFQLANNE